MSLHHAVAEAQRVVGQVEGVVDEAREYPAKNRAEIAAALSDLACRLELVRCAVLDPETENPEART